MKSMKSLMALLAVAVGLVLPSIADGVVAKIGDAEYTSLGEAFAAVGRGKPLTWVAESVWAADKQAYYNGTFYTSFTDALLAANDVESPVVYVRPNYTGLTIKSHDHLNRSITVYGNNARVGATWEPSIDYIDPEGESLTQPVTQQYYNLHDGAGFWGGRTTDYTVNVAMFDCTNVHEVLLNSPVTGKGLVNITLDGCTFELQNGDADKEHYATGCPVTTVFPGTVIVKNTAFKNLNTDYPININNKTHGEIVLLVENCTFDNCGNATAGAVRMTGSGAGTTIVGTVKDCLFTNNDSNLDIIVGNRDAAKNKAEVSYTIVNTAAKMDVIAKDTATVVSSTIAKSATPVTGGNVTYVAKIGTKSYTSLDTALASVKANETIKILKGGDYTVQQLAGSNYTIDASEADGEVRFNRTASGWVAGCDNVTVKNVIWNVGVAVYQYIQGVHAVNCTFNGIMCTHVGTDFDHCTFKQTSAEYCLWLYYGDTTFDTCTFETWGKALNLYNEGNGGPHTITIKDCTFKNSHDIVKPAVLIKSMCGAVELLYDVDISGCKLEGNWPDAEHEYADGQVKTSGIWDVEKTGKGITTTLDNELVWANGAAPHYAVKIGKKGYASLSNAVEAAVNGDTLVLQEANAEKFLIGVKTLFTIDPSEYEFAASNLTAQKGCELVQNLDNTWSHRMKVEVVDQVSKTVVRTAFEEKSESAAVAIADSNFKQIFKTTGSKELEFIAPGVGTVTFNSSAVDKIGANMKKAIQAIGGEEDSANTKTTLTLALADVSDEVKPAKPTVIISGGKPQDVVQTFSVAAVMQTLVQQGAGTTSTNEEVFAQGKTGDLDEATVTIPYSGIKPQVWFVDTAVSPWTTNDVWTSYDAGTKKLSFKVTHFSDYPITDAEVFAKVGDEKFGTLQEAFDFVKTNDTKGTTVVMTKDNAAGATLAADVTATLDMNGKKMTKPIVNNGGTLTITGNGEIDVGTVQFAQGAGKTYIKDGTYTGVFPDATGLATNAGPILVSGGKFKVSAPVPAAFCAVGYLPVEEPVEGFYTVKDANVYIRNINAVQRYPWNGYVDITAEVCWGTAGTATLYVTAVDKQNGDKDLGMTWVDLYVDGVKAADQVNCATGFTVEAATQKKLRLVWNSTEGVPSGSKKDRVGFKFLAK